MWVSASSRTVGHDHQVLGVVAEEAKLLEPLQRTARVAKPGPVERTGSLWVYREPLQYGHVIPRERAQ